LEETIAAPIPEITRDEIRARLNDPALRVLDVLPRASYDAGHIPGAISLPVAEIPERARELLPDRAQAIAVYCGGFT
jgi:rhodanese-related sulfurtransferase